MTHDTAHETLHQDHCGSFFFPGRSFFEPFPGVSSGSSFISTPWRSSLSEAVRNGAKLRRCLGPTTCEWIDLKGFNEPTFLLPSLEYLLHLLATTVRPRTDLRALVGSAGLDRWSSGPPGAYLQRSHHGGHRSLRAQPQPLGGLCASRLGGRKGRGAGRCGEAHHF